MRRHIFHFLKLVLPPFLTDWVKKKRHPHKKERDYKPNLDLIDSFSQYQEDLILDAILGKDKGFYIDVGANDPKKFSNTLRFYKKGWTGINIEPQPKKIELFNATRDRDINLNIGINTREGWLDFYNLKIDTLSTFDRKVAEYHCKRFNTEINEVIRVKVQRLDVVLEQYLKVNSSIDFMSIDTEGFDTKVLASNDWSHFRPKVVLIEVGDQEAFIMDFFESIDYELVYKNSCNSIFMDLNERIKKNE